MDVHNMNAPSSGGASAAHPQLPSPRRLRHSRSIDLEANASPARKKLAFPGEAFAWASEPGSPGPSSTIIVINIYYDLGQLSRALGPELSNETFCDGVNRLRRLTQPRPTAAPTATSSSRSRSSDRSCILPSSSRSAYVFFKTPHFLWQASSTTAQATSAANDD